MNDRKLLLCKFTLFLEGQWQLFEGKTTTNQNFNLVRAFVLKNNSSKRPLTVSNFNILTGSRKLFKLHKASLKWIHIFGRGILVEFRIRPGKFLPLMILWLLDDHLDHGL